MQIAPHLHDVSLLGEGAFGRVYRARDAAGRQLAIKVLLERHAARPEVLWQFDSEYRRLARLAHEAFPRVYEEGRTAAGLPYYSMDMVAGEDLDAPGPRPAEHVRRVLVGVAGALAYMHGLGLVHGDLKPENVRLLPDGRVVLLDVGMVGLVGQKRDAIAGTLEFLAPEVFRKVPVDPASDLYALGVTAYRLWTGELPFKGTPAVIVRAHLQTPPPLLAGRTPDHDRELEQLIYELLAKDPTARPASAVAVLERLGVAAAALPPIARARGLLASPFIGHETLFASWQAMLDARAGGWLVVAGGHGLGKTRALDELRLQAQLSGRTWVGAACKGEGDAPAAALRAVTGQALAVAELEPSPVTAAWLAGHLPAELQELDPAARKVALYDAVGQDLRRAGARTSGLAVGLDDWHLADGASRDAVAFLRQAAAGEGALLWVLVGDDLRAEEGDRHHVLVALTDAEATALVAARVGTAPPAELLARVLPVAAGNPLLLDMLLEHFAADGQLVREETGLRFAPTAGSGRLSPTSLSALWLTRAGKLPPLARRLAVAAAVAAPAGELGIPLLADVAGIAPADRAQAVDALLAAGLLVAHDGRARLALPELADVFAEDASELERGRWASQLATQLVVGAGDGSLQELPLDTLTRAARLALAGDAPAMAFELACEAGRRALALAAPAEALSLLEAAGERLPAAATPRQRTDMLLPRAEARRVLDQGEAALADYTAAHEAAVAAGDLAGELAALFGKAKCLQLAGNYPAAVTELEAMIARAQGNDTQLARAMVTLARVHMFQGEGARALALGRQAVALAKGVGALGVTAKALNMVAALLVQEDLGRAPEALALLDEALALTVRIGDRAGQLLVIEIQGNVHLSLGDLARAAGAFARYGQLAREIGFTTEATFALLNQAIAAAEAGDGATAARLAEEVERRALAAKRKYPRAAARVVAGQAAWRLGRPDQALAPCDEALAIALEIKNRYLEEYVRVVALELALGAGDMARARAEAASAAALIEQTGHADARPRLASLQAELAWRAGEAAAAGDFARGVLSSPDLVAVHRAQRVLAELALAADDAATATRHAEAALGTSRRWDASWHEQADAALLARATLAAGDPSTAAALARGVLEAEERPGRPCCPYARASALAVLERIDAPAAARARPAVLHALAAGFANLQPERRQVALAGLGLAGLADALAPTTPPEGGDDDMPLAIDPQRYASLVEAIAAESDETALGRTALLGAMELVAAQRGYMLAYEDGRLRQALTHGIDFGQEIERGFSNSIAEHVLFEGEPLYVQDASTDSSWQSSASVVSLGLRTVICLPLATPTAILGVLYMDREDFEPLLVPADIAFMHAYATMAASAIQRERARRAAEAEAARDRARAELGATLARERDPAARARALLAALLAASGAERAFWLAPGADGWQAVAALDQAGRTPAYAPAKVSQSVLRWVQQHGEPLTLLGTDESDVDGWQPSASIQALGLKTLWCLPAAQPAGALVYLDSSGPMAADPAPALATLEALLAYAGSLALATG